MQDSLSPSWHCREIRSCHSHFLGWDALTEFSLMIPSADTQDRLPRRRTSCFCRRRGAGRSTCRSPCSPSSRSWAAWAPRWVTSCAGDISGSVAPSAAFSDNNIARYACAQQDSGCPQQSCSLSRHRRARDAHLRAPAADTSGGVETSAPQQQRQQRAAEPRRRGVVVFLPKNTDLRQLSDLALPNKTLEVERNILDGFFKGISVYFWDGVSQEG